MTSNTYLSPNKWYYIYAKYSGLSGTPDTPQIWVNGSPVVLAGTAGAGSYSSCGAATPNVNTPGVSVGGVQLGAFRAVLWLYTGYLLLEKQ